MTLEAIQPYHPVHYPLMPQAVLAQQPATAEEEGAKPAWVVATYSNRYDVVLAPGTQGAESPKMFQATLKATLKKAGTDVWVGDGVWVTDLDATNASARIVGVWPRASQLSRPKIANVGHVLLVHPLTQPEFDAEQLDRYLALAHASQLEVSICLTKADLLPSEALLDSTLRLYAETLGYPVFAPHFHQPESYQPLQQACHNRLTVLAGLSGAGKSSLLNRLNPNLGLKEGEVSHKLARGQHTTRHIQLLSVAPGIVVADTPGFSRASFDEIAPETIRQLFPEIHQAAAACEFANCYHSDGELGCAMPDCVDQGTVTEQRWAHFKTFMAEAMAGEDARKAMSEKTEYGEKSVRSRGGKAATRVRLNENLRGESRRRARQTLQPHAVELDEDDAD